MSWFMFVVTVVVCVLGILWLLKNMKTLLLRRPKIDYKEGIIYVHVFPRRYTKKVVNLSPYAIKLETWLRMKGIPYEVVETRRMSSSTQQVPYIMLDGVEYADSNLIIDKLMDLRDMDPTDGLSLEQQAISRSFNYMLDEHTAWTYFIYRYVYHTDTFSKYFRTDLPRLIHKWIFSFLMKTFLRHSLRRKPLGVIVNIGLKDIRALADYLGEKKYFMGDRATKIDCTVFGHLSQVLYPDMPYPHKDFIKSQCPNLVSYMERIRNTYWSDWDSLVDHGTFE